MFHFAWNVAKHGKANSGRLSGKRRRSLAHEEKCATRSFASAEAKNTAQQQLSMRSQKVLAQAHTSSKPTDTRQHCHRKCLARQMGPVCVQAMPCFAAHRKHKCTRPCCKHLRQSSPSMTFAEPCCSALQAFPAAAVQSVWHAACPSHSAAALGSMTQQRPLMPA